MFNYYGTLLQIIPFSPNRMIKGIGQAEAPQEIGASAASDFVIYITSNTVNGLEYFQKIGHLYFAKFMDVDFMFVLSGESKSVTKRYTKCRICSCDFYSFPSKEVCSKCGELGEPIRLEKPRKLKVAKKCKHLKPNAFYNPGSEDPEEIKQMLTNNEHLLSSFFNEGLKIGRPELYQRFAAYKKMEIGLVCYDFEEKEDDHSEYLEF